MRLPYTCAFLSWQTKSADPAIAASAEKALEEIAKDKDSLNCPPGRLIIDELGKVVELSGQPVLQGRNLTSEVIVMIIMLIHVHHVDSC